jgi:hypothetical protein
MMGSSSLWMSFRFLCVGLSWSVVHQIMGKAEKAFLDFFDIGAGREVADGVIDLDFVIGGRV